MGRGSNLRLRLDSEIPLTSTSSSFVELSGLLVVSMVQCGEEVLGSLRSIPSGSEGAHCATVDQTRMNLSNMACLVLKQQGYSEVATNYCSKSSYS